MNMRPSHSSSLGMPMMRSCSSTPLRAASAAQGAMPLSVAKPHFNHSASVVFPQHARMENDTGAYTCYDAARDYWLFWQSTNIGDSRILSNPPRRPKTPAPAPLRS